MRKKHIKLLLLALLPVIVFSCAKTETNDNIDQLEKYYLDNPEAISQVKFVHAYTPLTINGTAAAVTATNGTVSGTGFRITLDGKKINGAQDNAINTNTLIWGGVYPPTIAYAFLPPGAHTVKFIMNRITSGAFAPIAGDEVFTSTVNFTAGKKYSMFIADAYTTPFMVEDNFEIPPLNQYRVRFINLTGETTTRYDVVSARHGKIFSDVGYREMQDYKLLTIPATSDTIYLRTAGTNTNVGQYPLAGSGGFTAGSQRVYTLYARGKTGVTGRTPGITIYTNR